MLAGQRHGFGGRSIVFYIQGSGRQTAKSHLHGSLRSDNFVGAIKLHAEGFHILTWNVTVLNRLRQMDMVFAFL